MPDSLDHLEQFERTAAELAEAFAATDPAAAVPNCPGWTVADLALHVGAGQRWAASIVLSGTAQKVPEVLRGTASWSDWYAGTSAALIAAIKAVDPDEPCWNFAPVDQFAGFWVRRRLHETVVHLVDARQAMSPDADPGIPPAVAADGVDEVFGVFLPRMLQRGFPAAVNTAVGVRAVDTGDEWTLTPTAQGQPPQVNRGQAQGAAVISGTAQDLLLALWRRLPTNRLTVEGDPQAAAGLLTGKVTP